MSYLLVSNVQEQKTYLSFFIDIFGDLDEGHCNG